MSHTIYATKRKKDVMLEFEIYIVLCYNGFKRIENHFISCLVKDNKYEQFWYSINKSLKIPKQYSEAAN